MRNGLYRAQFKTPFDFGAGVIVLRDGAARGGDAIMFYVGEYKIEGQKFTANLKVAPHTQVPGGTTVFGTQTVSLSVQGTIQGDTANLTGTAKEAPGVKFEAVLTRLAD